MIAATAPTGTPSAVDAAAATLRAGRPVLLRDHGAGGGNVVVPAALADSHWTSWAVRWTSGFLCAPMPDSVADTLDLPEMIRRRGADDMPAFTVAVDAASGTTTGISAHDRARTAQVLADPGSSPSDLTRPGHLVPIRIGVGELISRPTRMAASVDLCRSAGLPPVALVGELVTDAGDLLASASVGAFAAQHGLTSLTVDDVVAHRLLCGDGSTPRVVPIERSPLPTAHGNLAAHTYFDTVTGAEHLVLRGPGTPTVPTVSVHLECTRSNVFGATDCTCSSELREDVHRSCADSGLLIYLGRPSSRRDHGCDGSDVAAAAAILDHLGARTVRLGGGDVRADSLSRCGITVAGYRPTDTEKS